MQLSILYNGHDANTWAWGTIRPINLKPSRNRTWHVHVSSSSSKARVLQVNASPPPNPNDEDVSLHGGERVGELVSAVPPTLVGVRVLALLLSTRVASSRFSSPFRGLTLTSPPLLLVARHRLRFKFPRPSALYLRRFTFLQSSTGARTPRRRLVPI